MRRLAALLLAASLLLSSPVAGGDDTCTPTTPTANIPGGLIGCTLDGTTEGRASWYHGPVAAAQWCIYPWKNCQTVSVTSHRTGVTIIVTPASFCDCYWMSDRRLIDLTPAQVLALGEDLTRGIYAVTVTPVNNSGLPEQDIGIPDTALDAESLDGLAHGLLTAIGLFSILMLGLMLIVGRKKP